MGVEVEISKIVKGREIEFTISGDNVGVLIGKRGNTLNSLQYLTKLVANRNTKQYIGITLDAENYRSKRKSTLESLSYRLAKQVFNTKKRVILEPMPSFERKIIHQALSNHQGINTTSEGNEPHRHKPKHHCHLWILTSCSCHCKLLLNKCRNCCNDW